MHALYMSPSADSRSRSRSRCAVHVNSNMNTCMRMRTGMHTLTVYMRTKCACARICQPIANGPIRRRGRTSHEQSESAAGLCLNNYTVYFRWYGRNLMKFGSSLVDHRQLSLRIWVILVKIPLAGNTAVSAGEKILNIQYSPWQFTAGNAVSNDFN